MWLSLTEQERIAREQLRLERRLRVVAALVASGILVGLVMLTTLSGCGRAARSDTMSGCDRARRSASARWKQVEQAWEDAAESWRTPGLEVLVKQAVRKKAVDADGNADRDRLKAELRAFAERRKARIEQARAGARAARKAQEMTLGTRLQAAEGARRGYGAAREPRDEADQSRLWMKVPVARLAREQIRAAQNAAVEARSVTRAALRTCSKR